MGKLDDLADSVTTGLSDKDIEKLVSKIRKKKKDYSQWKDHNTVLNEYPIIGGKKWFKLQIAKNNETAEKYMRIIRTGQSLSIKEKNEFTKFLTYLKTGAVNLDWYDAEDLDILQNLDDYLAKNKDQKDKIEKLRSTIAGLRERILSMDITQFENALEEFKKIYTNEHEEKDIQNFLTTNAWILGDEYVYQQPVFFSQFPMWKDKLDFFVKRYDTFYDIIEIKKATAQLFVGLDENTTLISPTREAPMAGDLKDAISQIINYLEEANYLRTALRDMLQIKIHKPKGIVIIGRSNKTYNQAIVTLNDYLNDIRILTYDDLYAKASEFVNRIKRGHS